MYNFFYLICRWDEIRSRLRKRIRVLGRERRIGDVIPETGEVRLSDLYENIQGD